VVNFAAGGIATPADAALMMQLGVDGVFVGSGIFKSGDPAKRAAAIVKATTHFRDAGILAEVSKDLGEPWWAGRWKRCLPRKKSPAAVGNKIFRDKVCCVPAAFFSSFQVLITIGL